MADIDIPQTEADALIAMEKHRVNDEERLFPSPGERISVALAPADSVSISCWT